MMRRVGSGFAIAALICLFLVNGAFGQRVIREEEFNCTGSVKSIQPLFQVTTEKDEIWNLNWANDIVPNEDIHITGEAEKEWLQSGMLVRISGKINTKKGAFLEPISAIEVIAMRPEIEPGLTNDNEPKATDDLFNSSTSNNKPPKKQKPQKLPEEMTGTIIGEIGSLSTKDGEIKIKVPGFKLVKGELAEKCKISVDMALPGLIRVGDKVTIKGTHYREEAPNGGAPGIGRIKKIDVTANAPFEPIKAEKRGKKPYDNAKPGDDSKETKPDEKGATKPDASKPAAGKPVAGKPPAGKADPGKPPVDPKKKS